MWKKVQKILRIADGERERYREKKCRIFRVEVVRFKENETSWNAA